MTRARLIQVLPSLSGVILLASVVLLPLVILPLGENFLLDSKTLLFLAIGLTIFSIWTLNAFLKKTIQLTFSPFLLPALLLLISTLLSGFFNTVYPMNQFVGFGGMYLVFSLIVILAPSLIADKFAKYFYLILTLPVMILAIASAAEVFQVGPSVVFNMFLQLGLPNSPLFSLSGSPLLA